MKVKVIRTAIIGGGLSYDVYVPLSELSAERQQRMSYQIWRESEKLVLFTDATIPLSHYDLPRGIARYDAWKEHDAWSRREQLAIARSVFPELPDFGDGLPLFWANGLLEKETSAEFTVEWDSFGEVIATGDLRDHL